MLVFEGGLWIPKLSCPVCTTPETPISDLQEGSLTFILMASLKQHRKSERKSLKPAKCTETKIDKPDQLMLQSVVGFHFPD